MIQVFNFVSAREINAAGTFFRYVRASSTGKSSRIKLKVDGSPIGEYEEGDSITLPERVSRWEIEAVVHSTVGEVQIGFGDIRSSKLTGDVSVIDEVTDALETKAGTSLAVSNWTSVALVTAASNVNGLIVRGVAASSKSGAAGQVAMASIVACNVSPTDYSSPMAKRITLIMAYDDNGKLIDKSALMSKRIPPKWGLWACYQVLGGAALNNSVQVQCELQ